ncbi:MAG TPA: NADH-quinone oxidoreductase subunit C [Usitatibacter sp.]|nr:NADH-quinone oxidoreductase subunit C [Usitatibacter sp.]
MSRPQLVDRYGWIEAARAHHDAGARLVSLWGGERGGRRSMFAAYATAQGLRIVELALAADSYPDLSGLFPAANRMQRAARDLLGAVPEGAADLRQWLRHGAWGAEEFPLRADFDANAPRENSPDDYPFVRVEGDGVHEIAVGPIHAGTIEPGHFRFSVVGEKVLRLEERLGYVHKGIDRRFTELTLAEGARLAGRVSGDSTVAFAWAYAAAVESMAGVTVPPRATWLRALMLERERVANHLGDLGALGNDGGFGFALAQFMRLKEDWVRASDLAFGHRFMMDRIVPGGVTDDPSGEGLGVMRRVAQRVGEEVDGLRRIFDEHSGLQDRFLTAGRVEPQLAKRLGLVGLAGRASAQAFDLRVDHPIAPYEGLRVKKVVHRNGDVAARVTNRFGELEESLRLLEDIGRTLPEGAIRADVGEIAPGTFGAGWIEGWRGEVLVALEAGEGGRIAMGHAHDPSWHNWPVLEHAIMGNIVPDFPLINKSFNLSYSGVDG